MEKQNKAQEKRNRENFNYINADIRRRLAIFENEYLNKAVEYEFNLLNGRLKSIEKEISDLRSKKEQGIETIEIYSESFKKNRTYRISELINNFQHQADQVIRQLSFDATIKMNTLNSSKKSYDEKVTKLVSTLVEEGFGWSQYKVEEIRDSGSRLAFMVSNNFKTVHARLIWVDAVEVAPHFRFITTTRKK